MFSQALELVLRHEGGYVNDPQDPGGETIYGISRRAHSEAWVDGRPTKEQAAAIYKRDYWDVCGCDYLPEGVALSVFDFAVNAGNSRAVKTLQRLIGTTADGKCGPMTQAAVRDFDEHGLIIRYARDRIAFYSGLSTWKRFGGGWSNRAMETLICADEVMK